MVLRTFYESSFLTQLRINKIMSAQSVSKLKNMLEAIARFSKISSCSNVSPFSSIIARIYESRELFGHSPNHDECHRFFLRFSTHPVQIVVTYGHKRLIYKPDPLILEMQIMCLVLESERTYTRERGPCQSARQTGTNRLFYQLCVCNC